MAQFCSCCGGKTGIFGSNVKLSDGVVCGKCLREAMIDHFPCSKDYSVDTIKPFLNSRMDMAHAFHPEKAGGTDKIRIDSRNRLFMLCGNLYSFSELVRFHHDEDQRTSTVTEERGGDGRAIGAMIGAAALSRPRITSSGRIKTSLLGRAAGAAIGGAIGGAMSGPREIRTTVEVEGTQTIDIVLDGSVASEERLTFDLSDADERKEGRRCLELLEHIDQANQARLQARRPEAIGGRARGPAADSTASTIEQYYNLYKTGAISMEEYTRKKNELLGIAPAPAIAPAPVSSPVPAPVRRPVPAPAPVPRMPQRSGEHGAKAVPQSANAYKNLRMPQIMYAVQPGQKTSLGLSCEAAPEIMVCIGWTTGDPLSDLTVTVRALDAGGQVVPSDAGIDVRHTLPTEQTNVSVRLSQLHPAVKKLSFELNDKSGASDAFGAVSGVWLRILRADHREILGFRAPDFSGNITSLVLGDIYFHRDEWKFNPVGRGLK